MNNIPNEQTQVDAQPVSTENQVNLGAKESSVSYGKFKDATALLNAYNSLEAEFTKRCQRVKELESALQSAEKEKTPTESQANTDTEKEITLKEKERILKEYLKSVLQSQPKSIVLDGAGVGVKTMVEKPKTISEAGKLAKDILTKK